MNKMNLLGRPFLGLSTVQFPTVSGTTPPVPRETGPGSDISKWKRLTASPTTSKDREGRISLFGSVAAAVGGRRYRPRVYTQPDRLEKTLVEALQALEKRIQRSRQADGIPVRPMDVARQWHKIYGEGFSPDKIPDFKTFVKKLEGFNPNPQFVKMLKDAGVETKNHVVIDDARYLAAIEKVIGEIENGIRPAGKGRTTRPRAVACRAGKIYVKGLPQRRRPGLDNFISNFWRVVSAEPGLEERLRKAGVVRENHVPLDLERAKDCFRKAREIYESRPENKGRELKRIVVAQIAHSLCCKDLPPDKRPSWSRYTGLVSGKKRNPEILAILGIEA